jgi:hypothetical protein
MHIYGCLFMPVCIRCASRIDCDPFPSFEESTVKLRRPSDLALWVPRSWRPWASVWWRQVSSDPLCPIYFIIHCPAYYEQPKDWLAFYLPCPWLPFGLLWLESCYCFTLINEHDVNTHDTMLSLLLWCWTVIPYGARAVSWVPLCKDLFVGWPSEKTVQPWEWNETPLAE